MGPSSLQPRRNAAWPLAALLLACALACGSLEQGERTLAPIQRLPDPLVFGRTVHPILQGGCGAATCHGRSAASLALHAADPLPAGAQVDHPLELPAPYLEDYYRVLAFCDLRFPENSLLLLWGTGAEQAHPGGAALGPEAREPILSWLRGAAP